MKRIDIVERADWREKAKADGFGFHTMYGDPYWTDGAAYVFTLEQIERDIEEPTERLHEMCLATAERVLDSDERMERLRIPPDMIDLVRASWANGDRHLYGRFDLAYDGNGPAKMLEYNADTPTSIFEAAYFQHNWMIDQIGHGRLPKDTDQYNFLQESLVEALECYPKDRIFHFTCWVSNDEDRGSVSYLMDCAVQAGHRVKLIDIRDIGVDAEGRFTDTDDVTIDQCFKLYPWEDMLREPFAKHLAPGVFVEPLWKSVISNKGFLALLWELNKGHPNLLETRIMGTGAVPASYVRKPFFSREGANITIVDDGQIIEKSEGEYGGDDQVLQERARMFQDGGRHAVLGSWVIGDRACGMGIREDAGLITRDTSLFIPHVIIG